MATRVIDDTKLQNIAVAIQGKDSGGTMTVDEMPTRIAAIPTFSEIDKNAPLIFIDWDGTIIQSYSREDALALEVLPNVENMAAYSSVDHEFLSFQTWNYSLAEIKTWFQTHSVGQLAVRAFYVTVDDKNHNYFRNPRLQKAPEQKKFYIQKRKISDIAGSEFRTALLEKVSIPNGVTSIGAEAFAFARQLKHVNLPNSVTSITGSTFRGCGALQDVNIPEGITIIPGNMFNDCSSITKMNIPDGVTIIGVSAFQAIGATSISIPDSVINILNQAFRYSQLVDIVIKGTPELENVNAFGSINSAYRIYVPRSNLTWFESATNWSSLYSHVVAIEDYIEYLESIEISVDEYK
jgi:hypothetical protein